MSKNGYRIIDSDIHLREPQDLWQRYVPSPFRDDAPKHVPVSPGAARKHMVVAGKPVPPDRDDTARMSWAGQHENDRRYDEEKIRDWDNVSLLKALDREGIDRAVVFPTMGLYAIATNSISGPLAHAIARGYNDWLTEYIAIDRKRLTGVAIIPPHDVQLAVKETRRAIKDLGFKGVFVRPNPYMGRNWHDEYYDPLWAALEELDAPVCFHEANAPDLPFAGDRFEEVFLQHIACHPLEQMLAMTSVIGGGVLERFKRLRVAFLEGNCSWLPKLFWRLDGHFEHRAKYQAPYLKKKPSEYFAEGRCFVAVDCDESPAKYVVDAVGDDTLVFSTDYPHSDSKYPQAVDEFLKLDLPESSKRKILWDNCQRLYVGL